jgi:hypothetical protein
MNSGLLKKRQYNPIQSTSLNANEEMKMESLSSLS